MKIRVLREQAAYGQRQHLASGSEHDLERGWALELLNRGDAESLEVAEAKPPAKRAEKRPVGRPPKSEKR